MEDAIALETTILRAQNTVQKRYGRRLPDAKGLAACVSAKNAILERLGRLPKQAADAPTSSTTANVSPAQPPRRPYCACVSENPVACVYCLERLEKSKQAAQTLPEETK